MAGVAGVRELLGGARSPRGRVGRRAEAGRVPGRPEVAPGDPRPGAGPRAGGLGSPRKQAPGRCPALPPAGLRGRTAPDSGSSNPRGSVAGSASPRGAVRAQTWGSGERGQNS